MTSIPTISVSHLGTVELCSRSQPLVATDTLTTCFICARRGTRRRKKTKKPCAALPRNVDRASRPPWIIAAPRPFCKKTARERTRSRTAEHAASEPAARSTRRHVEAGRTRAAGRGWSPLAPHPRTPAATSQARDPPSSPAASSPQGRSQEVFFFIVRGANHTNLYKNLIKI